MHEETECWIYRPTGSTLEMLFAFYHNFNADDLICNVIRSGEAIEVGEGASVQFNAGYCFSDAGSGSFELEHPGRVTVRYGVSRRDLLQAIEEAAPEALLLLGHIDWPFALGNTLDPGALIDRLFLYSFAIEQAKRLIRGEPRLPSLTGAQEEGA